MSVRNELPQMSAMRKRSMGVRFSHAFFSGGELTTDQADEEDGLGSDSGSDALESESEGEIDHGDEPEEGVERVIKRSKNILRQGVLLSTKDYESIDLVRSLIQLSARPPPISTGKDVILS